MKDILNFMKNFTTSCSTNDLLKQFDDVDFTDDKVYNQWMEDLVNMKEGKNGYELITPFVNLLMSEEAFHAAIDQVIDIVNDRRETAIKEAYEAATKIPDATPRCNQQQCNCIKDDHSGCDKKKNTVDSLVAEYMYTFIEPNFTGTKKQLKCVYDTLYAYSEWIINKK